jgi:hypothetical protein
MIGDRCGQPHVSKALRPSQRSSFNRSDVIMTTYPFPASRVCNTTVVVLRLPGTRNTCTSQKCRKAIARPNEIKRVSKVASERAFSEYSHQSFVKSTQLCLQQIHKAAPDLLESEKVLLPSRIVRPRISLPMTHGSWTVVRSKTETFFATTKT